MVEDINQNRRGGRPRTFHTHGVEALKQLKADYSLLDIWRERHSNVKQYTWNSRFENIASRIDGIYLNSAWLLNVKTCYIHPFATQVTSQLVTLLHQAVARIIIKFIIKCNAPDTSPRADKQKS